MFTSSNQEIKEGQVNMHSMTSRDEGDTIIIGAPNYSLFNLYTESVIREAGIEEIGIKIGGKLASNLRYADDTALCANSQEEAERLIGKVNIIGKSRLLKLNVKKTKFLKIGKMQCDAGVSVDDEEIEVVEHFKYLVSLKSADGNCSRHQIPNWNGQEKTARSCTGRYGTTRAYARWCGQFSPMAQKAGLSQKLMRKGSNHQNCGFIVGCYESVGLNIEQTTASSRSLAPPDSF